MYGSVCVDSATLVAGSSRVEAQIENWDAWLYLTNSKCFCFMSLLVYNSTRPSFAASGYGSYPREISFVE